MRRRAQAGIAVVLLLHVALVFISKFLHEEHTRLWIASRTHEGAYRKTYDGENPRPLC